MPFSKDSSALGLAHFGEGNISINMDSVQCTGSEVRLIDCPFDRHTSDCLHHEDAGVQCQPRESSLPLLISLLLSTPYPVNSPYLSFLFLSSFSRLSSLLLLSPLYLLPVSSSPSLLSVLLLSDYYWYKLAKL